MWLSVLSMTSCDLLHFTQLKVLTVWLLFHLSHIRNTTAIRSYFESMTTKRYSCIRLAHTTQTNHVNQ